MVKKLPFYVLGAATGLTLATASQAATFASTELSYDNALLSSFNLVNLNNYSSTAVTQGRAVVGGNASFSGGGANICGAGACANTTSITSNTSPTSTSTTGTGYGALTVFGSLAGTNTSNTTINGTVNVQGSLTTGGTYLLNNNGGFNLGGNSASGTTVLNSTQHTTVTGSTQGANYVGGTANTASSVASVFPFGASTASTFTQAANDLSTGLADLPGSPGVTTTALAAGQTTKLTPTVGFTATNGETYGVVTTTLANLAAEGTGFGGVANGTVNGTTDAATFVVVTGGGTAVLPTLTYTDPKVIYDFVNATALTVSSAFNGTILAPLATITQGTNGVINGSLVVASITQTQELANGNLFTGDLTGLIGKAYGTRSQVPEPASLSLVAAGAAAMALLRRRMRRAS